jgi:pimeloyl-ACP methyl ester carboxylesterase
VRRAVLAVVLAAAFAAVPGAHAADLPRCKGDPSARCGKLDVPLHRADPAGPSLTIRFRVHPRTDRSRPAGVPIVAAEGGPGYGSIDSGDGYRFMLGQLRRDHDLILVDNRGTGRSGAIDCPRLQAGRGSYARNVGRCARQLGPSAGAYGTGAAADDLAAILDRLRIPVVSIYGDSYGTYFAQAFAVRHPTRVRAVVLDAAFAVDGFDPWGRATTDAIRAAWSLVCTRSPTCPSADAVDELRRLALRLEARPLAGRARDADGARHRVRLDAPAFAQLVNDASYGYAIFRDLLAAGRAYAAGDPLPLLRLAAEDLTATDAGPVRGYSEGAYAAVACHDYPTIWNPASSYAQRRAEVRAAKARLAPDAFAPFTTDTWLASLYEHQLVYGCVEWPAPAFPDPPAPPGAPYPTVPVLVLNGDLDAITPPADAARATALFPGARMLTVENAVHVTALADFDRCASRIVRTFLRTLAPGDARCVAGLPELHVVPAFPRRAAAAPQAERAGGDRSRPRDRRVAWAAAQAVADAFSRWWLMSGSRGQGLRGGHFTAAGAYYSDAPVRLRLAGVRFVRDVPVSGRAAWDRRGRRYAARVRVPGGRLRIAWAGDRRAARATITGRLGGRTVRLEMPAP